MTILSDYAPWLLAWLLEISWQVAILIGLIFLARWCFGPWISPMWRYALWGLVLIRLLLPALPNSPLSIFNLFTPEQTSVQLQALTSGIVTTPIIPSTPTPFQTSQSGAWESGGTAGSAVLIVSIWLLGVLICSLRMIWSHYRLQQLLACLTEIKEPELLTLLTACQRQLGLQQPLQVLAAPFLNGPAVTGLRQPVLLWPPQLNEMLSSTQCRLVLLHELAHIKHRDLLIQGMISLLQAVYWFHPLVWLAFRQMRIDRELACDARVIALSGQACRQEYGHAILQLVHRPESPAVLSLSGGYRALEQRMRMLARAGSRAAPLTGAALMIVLAGIGLTGASNPFPPQAKPVHFTNTIPPSSFAMRLAAARGINLQPRPGPHLTGILHKPEGQGPFPAVVLLHGCRGLQPYQSAWAQRLAHWGYAVLQVDSLGSRGVQDYCTRLYSAGYPHSGHFIADAYDALAFLNAQPFVDPERIAVMGWAQIATLASISVDGMQQVHPYKFRAAVALYPHCGLGAKGAFYAPSLVLIGNQDDWTPAPACRILARKQTETAYPMTLKVYPHAQHGFDNPIPGGERYEERVQNLSKFPAQGATLGYNQTAHTDALNTVSAFLAENL